MMEALSGLLPQLRGIDDFLKFLIALLKMWK